MNEVIVGKIGVIYRGENAYEAEEVFKEYCLISLAKLGRASGEDVDWLKDGEEYRHFSPKPHSTKG